MAIETDKLTLGYLQLLQRPAGWVSPRVPLVEVVVPVTMPATRQARVAVVNKPFSGPMDGTG
jgi:hypothetical protein